MLSRIKFRDRLGTAVVLAVTAALLSGCGGSGPSAGGADAAAKPGGTLTVAISEDPETLTPAEALNGQSIDIVSQIDEPLFALDEAGNYHPLLATKLTTSPDGLTSKITIRSGIEFSDGRPMTSSDVAFSIDAARKSPYYGSIFENVVNVSAPSPTTVVIKMKKPIPFMKANLASWLVGVVPKNYGGETAKEFSEHPIGTGPFQFKSWSPGESIRLVKNTNYWRSGLPLLNEVDFLVSSEDNNRVSQLKDGQVDVIQQPLFPQLAGLEQAGFQKSLSPKISVSLMLMNQAQPIFKDPRIRKAIDIAVDRRGIANTAFNGAAEPAGSYLPPTMVYYDNNVVAPSRNVDEAKALVAAAVKEGVNPSFKLLIFTGNAKVSTAAQIIQQDLDEIGLKVTLEPLEAAAALSKVEEGAFDASMSGYYSAIDDPSELTSYVISYMLKPSGANVQQMEALAARAISESDPGKRQELYSELQADIAAERDLITLTYADEPWVMAGNVVGFEQNPINIINLLRTGFAG